MNATKKRDQRWWARWRAAGAAGKPALGDDVEEILQEVQAMVAGMTPDEIMEMARFDPADPERIFEMGEGPNGGLRLEWRKDEPCFTVGEG